MAQLNSSKILTLIDGSGFIFRAFHALPPLTRPDGTPVGAVLGFCNMLQKLVQENGKGPMVAVFDASRKSFRNDLYGDYKAHRPEPPPELVPQFALCREAARAYGLPSVELEGYEADDLIATYACQAHQQGIEVRIISSDKDLMQLIRPGICMLDPMKNREITPEVVMEKFGVAPERVGDVLALMGDSSDNIPGAPGIGPKTAAELINQYGDLEGLLANANEIKQPKRRAALLDNLEIIRLSRKLVALDENAPLPVPIADLKPPAPDYTALSAFLRTQHFRALLTRAETAGTDGAPDASQVSAEKAAEDKETTSAQPVAIDRSQYPCIQDIATLQEWVDKIIAQGFCAVDTETDSLTPATARLVGVSLALAPNEACYIPLQHGGTTLDSLDLKQLPLEQALAVLKPMLEDESVLKIAQNMKFDWQVFAAHGIHPAPWDDTMLMSYALDNGLHGHGMDELSERFLGHKPIAFSEICGSGKKQCTFDTIALDRATEYAAEDADVTLRLWQLLKPRLLAERRVTLYETIERPIVGVIAGMEQAGVLIDPAVLRKLSDEFAKRMAGLEGEIAALVGHPFNIGSPAQLGEVLFGEMGLPGGVKGKTGAYSTSSDVLDELSLAGHVLPSKVLEWRQYQKLKSTYADSLPLQINARTGRVHTAFSLASTSTGRLASSDPNLQNIPIRTAEGKAIRGAFIAPPGHVLLSADYSQIELRLIAHMADIPALKEAFITDTDIHARTASEVFGVPMAQMTLDLRRQAKAINFGIIYGISAFGLARQLGVPQAEAAAFIKLYFSRFPQLKDFMDSTKKSCREKGYVETLYGRRCYMPNINDRNPARRAGAERQAINAPVQGTAADIIKRAMIRLPGALAEANLATRMVLQVHDELLFEVPLGEEEQAAGLIKGVMQGAASLSVPLLVETGVADNWAAAH